MLRAQYRFVESAFEPTTFHLVQNFLLDNVNTEDKNVFIYLFTALFSDRLVESADDLRAALAPGRGRRRSLHPDRKRSLLEATGAGFSIAFIDTLILQWRHVESLTGISHVVAVQGLTPQRWALRWLGAKV